MKVDAWWFENKQPINEIIQPKWFTPRTHFSIYLENDNFVFPLKISIFANKNENTLFFAEYVINDLQDTNKYEILQKNNAILFKGFADDIKGLPSSLTIQIINDKKTTQSIIPLTYATISGKTTDFQGNPFPSAVVFQRKFFGGKTPSIGVWSNKNGEYSVTIPTGKYGSFYVDDNSYNVSTLENWSWNMNVIRDEIHDFKIGNGEVYNLFVAEEKDNFVITFRPMVLPTVKKIETFINIDDEKYLLLDIQPNIEKQDLSVLINGNKIHVVSLEKDYEKIINNGKKVALIIYNVRVKKPELLKKNSILILEYQTKNEYLTYAQGRTHIETI